MVKSYNRVTRQAHNFIFIPHDQQIDTFICIFDHLLMVNILLAPILQHEKKIPLMIITHY